MFVLIAFLRVLYNNIHHVNQRSKLHTYRAEVPVLHTPVEVRLGTTCRFVHGQGKQGNVHIPAIMSVASLMFSCLTVSFSCVVYSRGNITSESEEEQTSVYLIKRKMKKKICIRTRTQDTRPGGLRSTALPHRRALHLYITSKLLPCVRLGMNRDRCCWHHAAETPLHDCTAIRVPKYHRVRNLMRFS